MAKKKCRYIGKLCIKELCESWVEHVIQETTISTQAKQDVIWKGCEDRWQSFMLESIARGLRGNQAAIESFKNETVNGQIGIGRLLQAVLTGRTSELIDCK